MARERRMSSGWGRVAMPAVLLASLAGPLTTGCTSSTFHQPVTASTSTSRPAVVEELGRVAVDGCDTVVVVAPVQVSDPSSLFDELLDRAEALGGDAVVDVQVRAEGGSAVIPFYSHGCYRIAGTAVRTKP